ncbi:hypothetical protein, partial [Neisseria meningitidis]|uniref:hypothetical protein n=1 Tax=Neisseria meningitidis TaxID=487 RepID=UPI001C90AC78
DSHFRRNDGGRFGRCGGFGRAQPILQSTLTAFYESAAILGNAKKCRPKTFQTAFSRANQ